MENTEDSASLISQRALTEALGGKKKRSKALRDIAARPLPGGVPMSHVKFIFFILEDPQVQTSLGVPNVPYVFDKSNVHATFM